MLKRVRVDGPDYFIYKFFKVKTFKRIVIYRGSIKNQWPVLYDVVDETFYSNDMEIKDIGPNLMAVWTVKVDKIFKIGVEGTIKAETRQDRMCIFGELMKETRKSFGLGKDAIFMNLLVKNIVRSILFIIIRKIFGLADKDLIGSQNGKIVSVKI
jgi:hypothetical protein